MKRQDFHYNLPPELIARHPLEKRTASRLLCLNRQTGAMEHRQFTELLNFLRPNDLLVFNDTRVIPARLFARKSTGGRVEILIERIQSTHQALAHMRASKAAKTGDILCLPSGRTVHVLGRISDRFQLEFSESISNVLEEEGQIPLPSYMGRLPESMDVERYQTVYARAAGAVAAPTAGLHFDDDLLEAIKAKGIETAFLTLHVGSGTFQPVRVEKITEHVMHQEWIEIGREVCEKIRKTKEQGGRVIAVGTTVVRSLESAISGGILRPFVGETAIFIYPGFKFQCVDAMVTNFHLPESTLLMLVSAFSSRESILRAYQEAIDHRYRFFSYGDAMFIS